jgi:5-methyltetrahydrofolate--homocysteine methyltransferase
MERQGFKIPLLIGGATTSRIHTAVKIDPHYSGPVVHVLDAGRSVPVAGKFTGSEENFKEYTAQIKAEYAKMREEHASRQKDKNFLSIEKARENKTKIDWTLQSENSYQPTKPQFYGNRYFEDYPLDEIAKYIDWTPFFQTWELHGKYPAILQDEVVGTEATQLFADAKKLLQEIIDNKLLQAKAVVGFYPAHSSPLTPDGGTESSPDDIWISIPQGIDVKCDKHGSHKYYDGVPVLSVSSKIPIEGAVLHHLRQQNQKAQGLPNLCLSDFVAPFGGLGAFALTAGIGIEALVEKYEADHDDYNSIMVKALADRLAEAFAELMHKRVRTEFWGYAKDENLSSEDLIKEKYQGIRPAPGYPACPDHTEKETLWKLLEPEKIGMSITESFAMYPASSVSGWYFDHPESKYFTIGKIGKDQVQDYAKRKGMTLEEAEKWLAPVLNY